MTIRDRESVIQEELTEAFEKLFAGFYGEIGAIVLHLQKAIHHWDNVSASYEDLVDFSSLLEPSPVCSEYGEEDIVLNELFKLAELNRSLDSLYRQIQKDRVEMLQSSTNCLTKPR